MATYQTYELVGAKEDISDIITNISPRKTPFQNGIGRQKIHQKLHQWQEDSLRAVQTNAAIEGADASSVTVTPTVLRSNPTQIFVETVFVSGTIDATSSYGRAKESAYQMAKSAAQVKRDLENALVGIDQASVTGNDSTARQTASYSRLLTAANNTVNMGTGNTVDEANLLTALLNCYTNGAEPNVISVTPTNSQAIAAFAKAAGRYKTISDGSKSVVNAVDLYVSPYGEVRVILNRFQKSTWTMVYEPDMWALGTLRPWFRQVLAQTGDAIKQMIIGEFALIHKNFLASSVIVDNSTSGF